MRLFSIVGTRPEFIQSSTIYHAAESFGDISHCYIHTGQHYDNEMSLTFWEQLGLGTPEYELNIGSHSQSNQMGLMLSKLDIVFADLNLMPEDWVIVYGDTNSTLAGALAAAKCPAGLVHLEAGMRSHDWNQPEEVNRVAADHLCDLALAPCCNAVSNLINEGLPEHRVGVVGDTIRAAYERNMLAAPLDSRIWENQNLEFGNYILVTIHRPENTNDSQRLLRIITALRILQQRGHQLIIPLHPRVDRQLFTGLPVIDPVSYFDMLSLEMGAELVITDSGGVQREAYYSRVPCVILRDTTEWRELLNIGWCELVSPLHNDAKVIADMSEQGIGTKGNNVDIYNALDGIKFIHTLRMTNGKLLHT